MYDVLLADPPWSYKKYKGKGGHGKANDHYKTLTKKQIIGMGEQIKSITTKNCALFLWATPPAIDDAKEVMTAWGFKYRTFAFTWVKYYEGEFKELTTEPTIIGRDNKQHKVALGMGSYTRANAEPCLLGVRGSMPVDNHSISSIILSPRLKHSRKPDEQYGKIHWLYPKARKLELFARKRHSADWDVWGDEVKSDIVLEVPK